MSEPRANSLPKGLILRGSDRFRAHYEKGQRETAGMLVGLALRSGEAGCRIGFSVPRKVGGAVVRNRVRRHLKEAFRLSKAEHPAGVDLVVLVRPHKVEATGGEEYGRLLGQLLKKMKARAEGGRLPGG